MNSPGRLSCDNVGDWEVDDRCIVALIMKRRDFHQVSVSKEEEIWSLVWFVDGDAEKVIKQA
jgi:hypothetical protein